MPSSRKTAALLLAAALALPGCGFHLRGSGGDTSFAQHYYIEGAGASGAFLSAFNSTLTGAGGDVVGAASNATLVVHLYKAGYIRQQITLSRTGQATGYDLIYRIAYDVRSPKGEILQGRREFEAKREYFNNQALPLAQLTEEAQIREELEREAAQTLLRGVIHALGNAKGAAEPVRPL